MLGGLPSTTANATLATASTAMTPQIKPDPRRRGVSGVVCESGAPVMAGAGDGPAVSVAGGAPDSVARGWAARAAIAEDESSTGMVPANGNVIGKSPEARRRKASSAAFSSLIDL